MSEKNIEFEKIIERVKSLYALSKSTHSQHEAEAAMKAAQQIITKYKIDKELLKEKTKEPYLEIIIYAGHKARIYWKEQIIHAVCHTNGCEVLIYGVSNPRVNGISYKAFGKQSNLELCKVLIELIINQIDYLAKEDKSIKGKDGKDAFKTGCAQRVKERLAQGQDDEIRLYLEKEKVTDDQKSKLMKLNDIERVDARKFMNELVGEVHKLASREKTVETGAFEKGKQAGDKISLSARKGLKE